MNIQCLGESVEKSIFHLIIFVKYADNHILYVYRVYISENFEVSTHFIFIDLMKF